MIRSMQTYSVSIAVGFWASSEYRSRRQSREYEPGKHYGKRVIIGAR
jgi:hypothetical protein